MPEGPFGFPRLTGFGPLVKERKSGFDVREYLKDLSKQHGLPEPEFVLEVTPQPGFSKPDLIVLQMVPTVVGEECGEPWLTYTKWHAAHEFYHYLQVSEGLEESEKKANAFANSEVPAFEHGDFPSGKVGGLVGDVNRVMFPEMEVEEAMDRFIDLPEYEIRKAVRDHPKICKWAKEMV